jgi:hypothetical protein
VSTQSTASTASAGCETTAVLKVRGYSPYARRALKRAVGRCLMSRAVVVSACFPWNRRLWNGTSCPVGGQGSALSECGCVTCAPCGTTSRPSVAAPVLADGSAHAEPSLLAVGRSASARGRPWCILVRTTAPRVHLSVRPSHSPWDTPCLDVLLASLCSPPAVGFLCHCSHGHDCFAYQPPCGYAMAAHAITAPAVLPPCNYIVRCEPMRESVRTPVRTRVRLCW